MDAKDLKKHYVNSERHTMDGKKQKWFEYLSYLESIFYEMNFNEWP